MRNADQWARWYFRQLEQLGPKGYDPVARRGLVYAAACWKCGGEVRKARTDGTQICADFKCAEAWDFDEAFDLKGSFDFTPRPGSTENALAGLVDVGRIMHELYHAQDASRRLCFRAFLVHARGSQVAKVAQEIQRAPSTAWTWIHSGRSAFATELERAGYQVGVY